LRGYDLVWYFRISNTEVIMRVKIFRVSCMLVFLATAVCISAAQSSMDPLTGTWTGDWGPSASDRNTVTVALKWDGKALTGTVNPGPNAVELQKCTFDPKTGAIHMEADATDRRGNEIHYMIDGKVENDTMAGSWNHGDRKGDFEITKE
jgi:hypothetical protein